MKVLLVCHRYPPTGVAGVERLSAQVAETLGARGHEVTVLTREPGEAPPTLKLRREVREGVPVQSIVGGGSAFERFPVQEPVLERIFERVLVEVDPDVVFATHLLNHSPGYVPVAHRWGVPVVLALHDFFMLCPRVHLQRRSGDLCPGPEGGQACATHCFGDQPDPLLRWSLRSRSFATALREADQVTAPSQFLADAFAARRGAAAPIRIVPNGVGPVGPVLPSESTAGGDRAPLRLASIGVTVEHKGFQTVVDALRMATLPECEYTIFGVALLPLSFELQEMADEVPGLQVRLFNGFSPSHLPVLLADADALVVPSIVPETYSIVAREAFACGVPVIAAAIGALPEAIREGDNGWLFEPGDAVDLAALLQRLDRDRSQLRRAAAGIRPDEVTSVEEHCDLVEGLLREAVEEGPGESDEGPELGLMREALIDLDLRRS
ncbi:MAG: glycosyltransferase [Solirubrobacterales bacterium]